MAKTKTTSKTKTSAPIDPSISSLASTPIPSNLDEALDPTLSSPQPTQPSSSSSSAIKKPDTKKRIVRKKKSQEPIVTVPNFSEEQIIQYHLLNPSVNPSFSSPFKTALDIYGAGRNRRSREPVKDEDRPRFSHPLPVIWLEQPQPPSSSGTNSTKKKSGKSAIMKVKRIHISTRSAIVPDQSNRLENTGNSAAFWLGSNEDTINTQIVGATGSTRTVNGVMKSEVNAKKSVSIAEEADVEKTGTDRRKRKRKEEVGDGATNGKEPETEKGKGKGKGKRTKAESKVDEKTNVDNIKNDQNHVQATENKKRKSDAIVENQPKKQTTKPKSRTKKQLKSSSPPPAPAAAIPVLTDQGRSLSESSTSSSSSSSEESEEDSDSSISNTNGVQYNSSSFTKPPPEYIRSSTSTSPIKQVPSKYIPIPTQPPVKSKSKSKSESSKTETPTYTITPLSDSKFKKRLSLLPTLTPTSTNTNYKREGETSTPTPGEKKKKRTSTGIVGNSKKGPKWVTETPKSK